MGGAVSHSLHSSRPHVEGRGDTPIPSPPKKELFFSLLPLLPVNFRNASNWIFGTFKRAKLNLFYGECHTHTTDAYPYRVSPAAPRLLRRGAPSHPPTQVRTIPHVIIERVSLPPARTCCSIARLPLSHHHPSPHQHKKREGETIFEVASFPFSSFPASQRWKKTEEEEIPLDPLPASPPPETDLWMEQQID